MESSSQLVDVQSKPCMVGLNGAYVKLDVVCRAYNRIFIGGWCTGYLDIDLAGDKLELIRSAVDRPDVSKHFGIDDAIKLGFMISVVSSGDDPLLMRFFENASLVAVSEIKEIKEYGDLSLSERHALGDLQSIVPKLFGQFSSDADVGVFDSIREFKPTQSTVGVEPLRENISRAGQALIVGSAHDLDPSLLREFKGDIYALNGAYFFLKEINVTPFALVTGDRRYLMREGLDRISKVRKIVSFDYALTDAEREEIEGKTIVELFPCKGRDGFSVDPISGFFHGCSSFFLAVQYLVYRGYKSISTVGVKFPPPELYFRVNDRNVGHPEFVYGIQLSNLAELKRFLNSQLVSIKCLDKNTNLRLFL